VAQSCFAFVNYKYGAPAAPAGFEHLHHFIAKAIDYFDGNHN